MSITTNYNHPSVVSTVVNMCTGNRSVTSKIVSNNTASSIIARRKKLFSQLCTGHEGGGIATHRDESSKWGTCVIVIF